MLLYLTSALVVLGVTVYWYLTRKFDYWKDKNVAFSPPVPLFGNLKDYVLRRKFMGHVIQDIYNKFPNEKVVGLYRMTTPSLLIRDLDIVKQILIKDFDMFGDRGIEFSEEGLGANIFHANFNKWRVLRGRFSPMFTSGKLKNMYPLLMERVDRIDKQIQDEVFKQPEQDVLVLAKRYTITAILACAFGIDMELDDPKLKILEELDRIILTPSYSFELDMMFPGILKRFSGSLFPAKIKKFFYDLAITVIEQRDGKPTNRKDFMDIILEMKQEKIVKSSKQINNTEVELELTDDVIAAQAFVFYVAGFETSATTAGFLLYELSQHPDVQDKLIAEIDDVLKKSGGNVGFDELMSMPYLTMVFDETLRKYPVVESLQRRAQVDYKIPGTDVVIEKGQIVIISVHGIHHDKKYYPNPEEFDPERFSPENSRERHPCASLAFGTGPRNCIGMRFGKLQARLLVVRLLSKFRIEPSKNTPSTMNIEPNYLLLKARDGIQVNVVPRKN